jgi:hypothetical protein
MLPLPLSGSRGHAAMGLGTVRHYLCLCTVVQRLASNAAMEDDPDEAGLSLSPVPRVGQVNSALDGWKRMPLSSSSPMSRTRALMMRDNATRHSRQPSWRVISRSISNPGSGYSNTSSPWNQRAR